MIDIKTQYAGLTLRNPIIVGSSGLTNKAERNRDFEKAGAGAIVLKSLFEEQIEMQSEALMQDSDYPEAADYIRGYVKANQVNDYLEHQSEYDEDAERFYEDEDEYEDDDEDRDDDEEYDEDEELDEDLEY